MKGLRRTSDYRMRYWKRLAFRLDLDGLGSRTPLDAAHDRTPIERARDCLALVDPADFEIAEAMWLGRGQTGFAIDPSAAARPPGGSGSCGASGAGHHHRRRRRGGRRALFWLGARCPRRWTPRQRGSEQNPDEKPSQPDDRQDADQPPQDHESEAGAQSETIVEAIQAALPDDLLSRLSLDGPARRSTPRARGNGDAAKSATRGRPVGSRSGALRAGARLNLAETLRAAAPVAKAAQRKLGGRAHSGPSG